MSDKTKMQRGASGRFKAKLPPTPENAARVRKLAAEGNTTEQIGRLFGVSGRAIKQRFQKEFSLGHAEGHAKLLKVGHKMATGERDEKGNWLVMPDRALLVFMLKARCGLRESQRVLPIGVDGRPIQPVQVNISPDADKETKPVLIVPGMWSEELWLARARDHQRMLLSRQFNQTMQGKKDI